MEIETRQTRVGPRFGWDELVLPDSQLALLRAIAAEDHRASLSGGQLALFTGGTGTGKTLAAQILAAPLGGPLFSLDLATGSVDHAAADELLSAARAERATVVFDHADLFLRGRSRPRVGEDELDADALLARCQRHRGLVVFTSTSTRGIKDQLIAQFGHVVDFPFPEADARRQIWRRLLPDDASLTDAEIDEIARSFQLSGAAISGCCTVAASIAEGVETRMQLGHVVAALELEYRERLASPSTLAALGELRRRTGVAEQVEVEPEEAAPPAARPRLRPGARSSRVVRWRPAPRAGAPEREASREPKREASREPEREASREPETRTWRPRLRRWKLPIALAATLLAAGLGFAVGKASTGQTSSAPLSRHATAGLFTASYPSSWHRRGTPARPQLGLRDQLSLSPAGTGNPVLVLGTSNGSAPSFLPNPVRAALPSLPAPQVVRLGPLGFYRYSSLPVPGEKRPETLYALPTTAGTIVADCSPGSASGFVASCERTLGTLSLIAATPLPLAPNPAYAFALIRIITGLNSVRVAAGAQLAGARDPGVVVAAANRMADADAAAAASLRRLPAGVASVPNAALATSLTQSADAYRALARAEIRGNSGAYAAAKTSITRAQAAADGAYEELFRLGYLVG